jgi:hypothetical protein
MSRRDRQKAKKNAAAAAGAAFALAPSEGTLRMRTVIGFICLLAACGAHHPASSIGPYLDTCAKDADCELALAPADCVCDTTTMCPVRAINTAVHDQYTRDLAAYRQSCAATHPDEQCGVLCITRYALCCSGACTAREGQRCDAP